MLKIFRYMKKNAGLVFIILILLFVQAYTDLSLPSYTSQIVDVGIQQYGVENTAIETIRRETMEDLLLVMNEEDRSLIESVYLADGDLYVLQTDNPEQIQQVSNALNSSMFLLQSVQEQQIQLSALPPEQLQMLLQQVREETATMSESIIEQAAIQFVIKEYKAQGIDIAGMQTRYLLKTGLKMLGLAGIGVLAAVLIAFLSSRVGSALGRDLREDVYRKVLSFSSREMNRFSTASLITRSTNDIQQVQMVSTMMFRMVLYAPIMGIGGLWKVLGTNVSMTWILGLGIGAIAVVIGFLMLVAMPRFKLLQKLIDKVNQVSREMLSGIMVIRAFSAEKREEERFEQANRKLTATNLFVNRCMTFMMPLMMLIMNSVSVLIIYSGAYGIDEGQMQVGDMMAFIQYAMQIIMSFLMIAIVSVILPRANVAAGRINEVLETKSSIENPVNPQQPDPAQKGTVEFRNVSFAYPGDGEESLSDISFKAERGQTVAVIGSTGSGKSTLIHLILRFFDVTAGEILVDGVDIRNMELHALRDKLGYVPQKSVLFSGTIESNLRYGAQNVPMEAIQKAASIAQAEEFIKEKEMGYESSIAQGGTNVSGGQKQRLSIARAIASEPEIYLFDDSFSALDFKTDAALRSALKRESSDITTILVAQRVSTIMQADLILVLDEGRLVGHGTHQELMKSCEVYRQIAQSQLSQEELGE